MGLSIQTEEPAKQRHQTVTERNKATRRKKDKVRTKGPSLSQRNP